MPWYWTDDLAQTLLASGQIEPELAERLTMAPVAVWETEGEREPASKEVAADDDDLPLAA